MAELSDIDLLHLHEIVEEHFDVFQGVKDIGLLSSIAERPSQQINFFIPTHHIGYLLTKHWYHFGKIP